MNMKDAMNILYPVPRKEEAVPNIVVGRHYLVDGECMEAIKVHGTQYIFHGASFSGWELDAKFRNDRKILMDAIPALSWEISDMKHKRKKMLAGAASYFEKMGTANE